MLFQDAISWRFAARGRDSRNRGKSLVIQAGSAFPAALVGMN